MDKKKEYRLFCGGRKNKKTRLSSPKKERKSIMSQEEKGVKKIGRPRSLKQEKTITGSEYGKANRNIKLHHPKKENEQKGGVFAQKG